MIRLNKEQVVKLHTQLIETTGGSHGIRDEKGIPQSLENRGKLNQLIDKLEFVRLCTS